MQRERVGYKSARVFITLFVLLFGVTGAYAQLKMGPAAREDNKDIPPNTNGPKDFEGIWWPDPAASLRGGPGGPPPGPDSLDRLKCGPLMHLSGGGGGSTVLIVQSSKQMVLSGEELTGTFQNIYIGEKHPSAKNLVPQPNGHSIGYWEGNTLVVDTIGYAGPDEKDNGEHIVERFTKNGNRLSIDITTTEKDGHTDKRTEVWAWRPDLQYNESICEEDFSRYRVVNGETESANTGNAEK